MITREKIDVWMSAECVAIPEFLRTQLRNHCQNFKLAVSTPYGTAVSEMDS
jgi:hypothetical protein